MKVELKIETPSKETGFVEDKRSFCVNGKIISSDIIPDDSQLIVNLYDKKNKLVRWVESCQKNQSFNAYYPTLTAYKEELDPKRKKLLEYGFAELIEDKNHRLNNATSKCWYSDTVFKSVITNSSGVNYGAILSDGFNCTDENNEPYKLLEKGEYTIEVVLKHNDELLAKTSKKVIIGKREIQLICRFNPLSHKQRMTKWCKDMNVSIIEDTLPGYLDTYLGQWFYHMGLLKMYRANDVVMYENVKVVLFDYLIDPTSTSYSTELSYLQTQNKINDIKVYHYDIGEAKVLDKEAQIVEFENDEVLYLCRIDVVNDKAQENTYFIDERAITKSLFDFNKVVIEQNADIAIMGVVKPVQLANNEVILNENNTYSYLNQVNNIVYNFEVDHQNYCYKRKLNMERIDKDSIGTSVYEFYNIIHIQNNWANKEIKVNCSVYDKNENKIGNDVNFVISVNSQNNKDLIFKTGEDLDMLNLDNYEKELYE